MEGVGKGKEEQTGWASFDDDWPPNNSQNCFRDLHFCVVVDVFGKHMM